MKNSIKIIVNYITCKKFYGAYNQNNIKLYSYRFAKLNLSDTITCYICKGTGELQMENFRTKIRTSWTCAHCNGTTLMQLP